MRVLVTGHDGYIGAVLTPLLRDEGHDVVGLDTRYLQGLRAWRGPSADSASSSVTSATFGGPT